MRKPGSLTAATISMPVLVCGVELAADRQCKTNGSRIGYGIQRAETLLGTDKFVSVYGHAGPDPVDCGAGDDTVYYDPGDTVRDCEVRRDLQGNPQ